MTYRFELFVNVITTIVSSSHICCIDIETTAGVLAKFAYDQLTRVSFDGYTLKNGFCLESAAG